jgi:outer membrane protein OmpA-like peptidoglycan-associated protein
MSRKVGYVAAIVFAGGLMSFGSASPVLGQVVDGTQGRISRCDLYRSLGRALPQECGGSGPGLAGVTRGRVHVGAPPAAPVAPVAAPAAAPAAPAVAGAPAAPRATATNEPTFASPPSSAGAEPRTVKGVGLPIPFELDSDVLRPQAMEIIDQLVEVFKANGTDRYLIEGHTDASGSDVHNRALSERRARAVVRYLVERHGLPESRFQVRGQGSANLLVADDPKNGRNRRVAILALDI